MNAAESKTVIKSSRVRTSRRTIVLLLAATAVAASTEPNLRANTVNSTWVGGTSANWSNAANWSPNSADPNNGNNGVSDYNVIINSVTTPNFAPTLDVTVTIDNLTLNTAATLALNSANTLNLNGSTFTNGGNVTLLGNGTFGSALLNFTNAASLNGGGTIILTDSGFSRIGGANLTNVDNIIKGAGHFTSNITNQGTITAQGGTLTFDQNLDNTAGKLSIAANGTLSIGGTMTGSISAAAGAQILGSGILSNVTLNTGSALTVLSATVTPTLSGTFTNKGTITVLGNGTFGVATLTLDSNGTALNGGGTIILTDSLFSRISGGNLTNTNDTIRGAGHFLSNVTNQGTIIAESGVLTFDQNINNTVGTINIAANGTLSIGGTLTGSITAAAGSQIAGSGILSNVTLNTTSSLTILSATTSPTLFGTFTNKGNITLLGNGTFGVAALALDGNGTTLNGGGTIILTDGTYSRIGGGNLTNVNNTIRGAGHFLSNVSNQGTIIAESGILTFDQNIDNTSGTLSIAANGTLSISGTLTGSVTAAAGSQITGSGTLLNVTLNTSSAWSVPSGVASPTLAGTFTNHGTVTLQGSPSIGVASLTIAGNGTTLNGGGTIILTDGTYSRIIGGNLTNIDNTIRGAGHFFSNITNHGTIIAEGGTLNFDAAADNASGSISVAANATLSINGTLNGGAVTFAPGSQLAGGGILSCATVSGTLAVASGDFSNVTLGNGSNISVLTGSLEISGTFTNHALVTVLGNGTFGSATLTVDGTGASLNGGGTIVLTDATYSRITGGNITNIDNTIRGVGHFFSNVTNHGTIIAEGGILTFDANADNTSGSLSVASNGTLSISGTLNGGTVTFAPGSQLAGNGIISSATVSGTIAVTSGDFSNVTLSNGSNLSVLPGSLEISGTFTNNSTVTLLGNGTFGTATLTIDGAGASLSGGGTIVMTDGTYSRISGGNLTNLNNTIRGVGQFVSAVTNHGTIIAEGGTLTFDADVDSTGATINIAANSTLSIGTNLNGGTITTVATSQIVGGGNLTNATLSNTSIWNVQPGASSPALEGTFTNKGTVTVLGDGIFGTATLTVGPVVTNLSGGGTIVLTDSTYSRLIVANGANLTNVNNKIQGTGTITLNGGTFNNSGNYNFNGTLSSADNINNSGNFTQSGTQLWSANTTFTNSGNATFNSDTGSGSTIDILNTAGLLQLSTPQNIHNLTITGGNVTLPTSANPRQSTGVVLKTSSLSISTAGILDVTNHDAIIGNTTLQTINDEILNGVGLGPGGAQLTSSTANASGNLFLIPIDAAANGISSWDNVSVTDPNSVIVKYTYFGDATLDGLVDGNDFSVIAGGFGSTTPGISNIGQSWLMGDVNLDGIVDGNDFSVVAGNFGSTILAAPPNNPISPTAVPEPASLALLVLMTPFLVRRRKN